MSRALVSVLKLICFAGLCAHQNAVAQAAPENVFQKLSHRSLLPDQTFLIAPTTSSS